HEALAGTEIYRHPLDVEQLGDAVDRGLERVRERQLGGRLADDGEQRARPLELELELARASAGAQHVSRAHTEGREPPEVRGAGLGALREQELEEPDGRFAERERGRDR